MNSVIFKHPFSAILSGPSQAGKTEFTFKLLQHHKQMFSPIPDTIIYCYSIWQNKFIRLKEVIPDIQFHQGIVTDDEIDETKNNLIILDDLMRESGNNNDVLDMFTRGSHHKNFSVILITQNLFNKGANTRTISLNAHYIVMFNNPRDRSQIRHLARQMYPQASGFLIEAFEDATSEPYSYLFIDLTQTTTESERIRTKIFPEEDGVIYVRK
jgi:hypothetical protein